MYLHVDSKFSLSRMAKEFLVEDEGGKLSWIYAFPVVLAHIIVVDAPQPASPEGSTYLLQPRSRRRSFRRKRRGSVTAFAHDYVVAEHQTLSGFKVLSQKLWSFLGCILDVRDENGRDNAQVVVSRISGVRGCSLRSNCSCALIWPHCCSACIKLFGTFSKDKSHFHVSAQSLLVETETPSSSWIPTLLVWFRQLRRPTFPMSIRH